MASQSEKTTTRAKFAPNARFTVPLHNIYDHSGFVIESDDPGSTIVVQPVFGPMQENKGKRPSPRNLIVGTASLDRPGTKTDQCTWASYPATNHNHSISFPDQPVVKVKSHNLGYGCTGSPRVVFKLNGLDMYWISQKQGDLDGLRLYRIPEPDSNGDSLPIRVGEFQANGSECYSECSTDCPAGTISLELPEPCLEEEKIVPVLVCLKMLYENRIAKNGMYVTPLEQFSFSRKYEPSIYPGPYAYSTGRW